MKKIKLASLGLLGFVAIANTAHATILTTDAHDFVGATAADNAALTQTIYGVSNTSGATITLFGSAKRNPSSAVDGSQTVTLEGSLAGTSLTGAVFVHGSSGTASKVISVPTTTGAFSKTVTLTSTQTYNTAYYNVEVFLPNNGALDGVYVN